MTGYDVDYGVTCCDYACYEDEGCACEGCRRNGYGWYADHEAGHTHGSALRCRVAVALYGITRIIGRVADRIDRP